MCETWKISQKHPMNRATIHAAQSTCFHEPASRPGKSAHHENPFFQNGPHCVFYLLRAVQKQILSPGAHLRISGANFGTGVLWLSVSVDIAMECQLTCSVTCFFAVSLSGTMWSAMSVLQKSAFGGHPTFSVRTQAAPIFSNIQRPPVHVP